MLPVIYISKFKDILKANGREAVVKLFKEIIGDINGWNKIFHVELLLVEGIQGRSSARVINKGQ